MSVLRGAFPDTTEYATVGAAEVAWSFGDPAAEYAAIRGGVAKMDASGAGLLEVAGSEAYDLLQQALARDLEFVTPEQSLTSLLLDADGRAVDVVIAYHSDDGYRLETSTGTGPATANRLEALRDELGMDADIRQLNDELMIILVEGPQAAVTLEDAIDPDLGALPLSGLMEVELEGLALLVSRSGFTGEYGYKIFVATDDAPAVWQKLDIPAAGAGALEAAMFEVRQPLLHREDATATALENGYAWLIDITKDEFVGRDAVVAAFEAGGRSRVVGYSAASSVPTGRPVRIGGTEVGTVVSSMWSPGRKEHVGLVRMRPDLVAPNLQLTAGGEAEGDLRLTTLAAPYVLPVSWQQR